MNEQSTDTQHIILTLDAHRISLDVPREEEPFYRKAGELLNQEYHKYQRKHISATSEQLWMFVALRVAVNLFASTRDKDLEPYLRAIKTLNREIETKLNN
ncbi:MAG: cell division protein ZapA [Paludibacteraceae bacterium]|nr:cell division protein ZapA [Bacteroidales bacterium]MCQ2331315.1 cell division protein ZapA [Paludibacteraceae bacterium]